MIKESIIFQLKMMAVLAWTDGLFTEIEQELFNSVLKYEDLSVDDKKLIMSFKENKLCIEDLREDIKSFDKETVLMGLKNSFLMVKADGKLDPKEILTIEKIAELIGIKEEKIPILHELLENFYNGYELENSLFN